MLITASGVSALNDLSLKADTGDVIVNAAQDTYWSRTVSKKSRFKLGSFLAAPVAISLIQDSVFYEAESAKGLTSGTYNVGSVLSAGNNINVEAGRDISLIGSAAVAGNDVYFDAGRDVNIIPGREDYYSEYHKTKTQIGTWNSLSETGLSGFSGVKTEKTGATRTGDYTAGSLVSAGNDVVITAGRDVNQIGSHIEAGRDAVIDAGQDWNMLAAMDKETLHQYVKQIEAGVSASVSQNVTDPLHVLADLPHDMQKGRGGAGFSGVTAASAGLRAIESVAQSINNPFSVSVTVGAAYSKTEYKASSTTALGSSITAGRDIDANAGRDITIEGGSVIAVHDIDLTAKQDINILAAKNWADSDYSSESGGGGIGVKAGVGSSGPYVGINVYGNAAGAESQAKYTTHSNSIILAGNTLATESGRDTTIAGAHLEGERVWMDTGGDLAVASLQDHSEHKSKSWSVGANVTIGYGANVDITMGGNISFGEGKGKSNWVGGQTSIIGREAVDIYAEGNTHMKGSVIAAETGALILNTGTFSYEDIKDKNKGSSYDVGISGGYSTLLSNQGGVKNAIGGNRLPSLSFGYEAYHQEQINRATVGEGLIIVRDASPSSLSGLNRDLGVECQHVVHPPRSFEAGGFLPRAV